ncbi:FAD-dependent oxidoreductase [Candidatus Riflebacteria bacterium]
MQKKGLFLTDAQLKAEVEKCQYCEEKPCLDKCPVGCSPAEFIMAVGKGNPSDFRRAAGFIYKNNPLGGVCGLVCPDTHCMSACSRKYFDLSVNIPAVQATIIQRAREMDVLPSFEKAESQGKKVAVIGAGPAGISSAVYLAQKGYEVVVFEKEHKPGGACGLIPEHRLEKEVLDSDISFWSKSGTLNIKTGSNIKDPAELSGEFSAVIVACGLHQPIQPGVKGEESALFANEYLAEKPKLNGNVAIYGGGAIAVDCAVTAKQNGASIVQLFFLESYAEMPLTNKEREELLEYDIELYQRARITEIVNSDGKVTGLKTIKVKLKEGTTFALSNIEEVGNTELLHPDFNHLIMAIGNRPEFKETGGDGIFYAGDMKTGPATVVEAAASGKNAALQVEAYFNKAEAPKIEQFTRCSNDISGFNKTPVSLKTDFFGREICSPFLLSAAPPSDGLEQMKLAYEAGWAGGIMKTSFQEGPIHIPNRYMHVFGNKTWGNCDNVSGHLLDRVTREVAELVKLYPDRLTIASTGGPVSGDDDADCKGWQDNTKLIEDAGAMAIEYSLSCPQGGDGTEGDIVAQNAALAQKIIGWIMEISDPAIPKIFKLTGAVTSIAAIVMAVKETLGKYPNKKAGITLANTFPVFDFRPGDRKEWEEGIVFGMSGEGVLPISYLSLANVHNLGVTISGNGGPMDYKAAANFLALGAKTVQFCTIAMKYGYGIIDDLENGLSYLMQERGIGSVKELIGIACKPSPIVDFMELTPVKMISDVNKDICEHCGNCSRCSYLAIELNEEDKIPKTDASKCIGCSICAQKCFSGALYMRERTDEELKLLKED